jgi:hypothetical protein
MPLVGFKFGDDIVKVSVYYFSQLPLVENKKGCNQACSKFYGIILLLVSLMTLVVQFQLIHVQWESVLQKAQDKKRIAKPGKQGSHFGEEIEDEASEAMFLSCFILFITMTCEVYHHTKAFCIAACL